MRYWKCTKKEEMIKEAGKQYLKNMTIVKNMDDVSLRVAKHFIKKSMALHLKCICGNDIFIGLDTYSNPNFRLLSKKTNHMDTIYMCKCPSCNETNYITSKELRVLRSKEEES